MNNRNPDIDEDEENHRRYFEADDPDAFDDRGLLRDGAVMRVRLQFCDSLQRSVADAVKQQDVVTRDARYLGAQCLRSGHTGAGT